MAKTNSKANILSPDLLKYREWLVETDHQASVSFDKAVMTLSGGALGISITFLRDVVPYPLAETKLFLILSWGAFAVSLASILISYLTSMASLRKTIRQVDEGTIYSETVGGIPMWVTVFLRVSSAIGFLVGAVSFLVFVLKNF